MPVTRVAEGEFQATPAAPLAEGVSPVTATVAAGTDTDLLAGEIDLHPAAHTDAAPAGLARRTALIAGAVAAVLLALVAAWGLRRGRAARAWATPSAWRCRMKRFHPMPSCLALLLATVLSAPCQPWQAPATTMATRRPRPPATAPAASPMAACFCPNPRSANWACALWWPTGQHAKAFELAGTVVMDPNAGGKVQAVLAGRLEAGPKGPARCGPGGAQGRGAGLCGAHGGAIERSNQLAQQAELRAARDLPHGAWRA